MSRPLFICLGVLSTLALLAGCLGANPRIAEAQDSGPPPAPPKKAALPDLTAKPPTGDAELAEWIFARYEAVPRGDALREIKAEDRPKIFQLVDGTIEAAGTHYRDYPDSPQRVRVILVLGKLMALNKARHQSRKIAEWRQSTGRKAPPKEMYGKINQEYFGPVIRILQEGLPLAQDPKTRFEYHDLLGECYHASQMGDEAIASYQAALDADPKNPGYELAYFNLCDTMERERKFDAAIAKSQQFLKDLPDSKYAKHTFFVLHKCYRKTGQFEAGLALWDGHVEKLKAEVAKNLPDRMWSDAYLDRYSFYKGFFNFALGNKDDAIKQFEAFLDYVDGKPADRQNPSTPPYRNYQALPYLNTLYQLVENDAPPFDVGPAGWLIPGKLEQGASPTSSIVLFCPIKSDRYDQLFPALQKLIREFEEHQLELVWISYPSSTRPEEFQQSQMDFLERAAELELDTAQIFDHKEGMPIHQSYAVSKGGANLFIVDAAGKVQWRLVDPMYWDEGLIRGVLKRVFTSGN